MVSHLKNCLHIRITGRVQGVCFRYYARMEAKRMGVTGHIRNMPDGSVEALICGNVEQLDAMQQWLAHGPEIAHVDDLQVSRATPENFTDDFHII